MSSTTIDLLRIPVDDDGNLMIDFEEARQILDVYEKAFPDRRALMMPANITIWEDLDIFTLKNIRNYIDETIKAKEQEV